MTVVRLEGGQVRLGIDAPREIAVVRAELVPERLAAEGKAAAPRTHHGRPSMGRIRRPVVAHETDSRRRGPSR